MNRDSFVGVMTVIFVLFLPFVMNPVGLIVLGITGPFALVGIISIFKSIGESIDGHKSYRYPACKNPERHCFNNTLPEPISKAGGYEYYATEWMDWCPIVGRKDNMGFAVIEHRIGDSHAKDKAYWALQRGVLIYPTNEEEIEKLHEFPYFTDYDWDVYDCIKVYKEGYPSMYTDPWWKFW